MRTKDEGENAFANDIVEFRLDFQFFTSLHGTETTV